MNKLFYALFLSLLGNIMAWFHMNAQFKWEFAKEQWWILLGGVPISYLFFYSTKMFYEHYGSYWAVRPIGFGIATLTFGFLTMIVLNELPSQRIIISLILAGIILYINMVKF
jgi:hypothetical protein|tara:strand:+ start:718 stop:1053 length:336 start_codon:yes stop_codon:yes gene_type:complete